MLPSRQSCRALCLVLTFLLTSAFAAPAGDFSGTFTLGTPIASGHDVQVTISLTVANNTPYDVGNATIALHEPRAGRVTYGQLTGLSLPAGRSAQVSGSFTVPRGLYESWQKGSAPAMSVSFADAQGDPVRSFIQF
jgi:hypothetical protein